MNNYSYPRDTWKFLLLCSTNQPVTMWPDLFLYHTETVPVSPILAFLVSLYWNSHDLPCNTQQSCLWKFYFHSISLLIRNHISTVCRNIVQSKVEAHLCKALKEVHETSFSKHQNDILLPYSYLITLLLEDINPLSRWHQTLSDWAVVDKTALQPYH